MAKKIKAIQFLGEKCSKCGAKDIFVLVFHHKKEEIKKCTVSELLTHPWHDVLEETKKCQLLCYNCHQEFHFPNDSKIKRKLLKMARHNRCSVCGVRGKSNSILSLHHIGRKTINVGEMCNYTEERFNFSIDKVRAEIKKCVVLCENCHQKLYHSNISKFEKFKAAIYEKIRKLDTFYKSPTLSQPYNKLDNKRMFSLCRDGRSFKEIANIMNCTIETVKRYLKRKHVALKVKLQKQNNIRRRIWTMGKNGVATRRIAKIIGCHETTVSKILSLSPDVKKMRLQKDERRLKNNQKIVKLYQNNYSAYRIASIVGLSDVHVGRILKQNGIKMRPSGIQKRCNN